MKSFLFAMLVAALLAGTVWSEDTATFRVDSYVPERFHDIEWLLNGNLYLTGSDDDQVSPTSFGESKNISRNGTFASYINYRWYSVPQFLSISLRMRGDFDYRRSAGSTTYREGAYVISRDSRSSDHRSTISGAPKVEFGRYVARSFFLSLMGEGNFSRDEWRTHSNSRYMRYDSSQVVLYSEVQSKNARVDSRVHMSGGFVAGWGRVYSGAYAVSILEIIRELRRSGSLLREPTASEYIALCDTVYLYRLRHSFDKRDNRIAAIKAIATQLMQSGIADGGVLPVLLISDVWEYYPRDDRQFGWRAYAGPVGIWDWSKTSYDPWRPYYGANEKSNESWGFRGTIEYFRPISLRWHVSGTADFFVVSEDWRFRQTAKHYETYNLDANLKYLFDSRTSGFGRIARRQNRSPLEALPTPRPSSNFDSDYWIDASNAYRTTEFFVGLQHRLAPPTRIALTFGQYWVSVNYPIGNQDYSRYTLSLDLTHWLY